MSRRAPLRPRPSLARFGASRLTVPLNFAFLAGLLVAGLTARRVLAPEPVRFQMAIPEEERIGGLTDSVFQVPLALSPDGKTLAYVVETATRSIFVRRRWRDSNAAENATGFVDDSKNRSRIWCKKECGDRVRARRHYARARIDRRRPS